MTHTCVVCKRHLAPSEFYLSCDCEAAHGVCQSCFEASGVDGKDVRAVVLYGKKHMGDHRIMRRKPGAEGRESLGAKLLFEQGDLSGVTAISLRPPKKPELPRWATMIITAVWFLALAYVGVKMNIPVDPLFEGAPGFLFLDDVMRLPMAAFGFLPGVLRWLFSAMFVCAVPHLFFHTMEGQLT
jgi:hypothetical protein